MKKERERVLCLKCEREFLSWDRKGNRLCHACKVNIQQTGLDQGLEEYTLRPTRIPTKGVHNE